MSDAQCGTVREAGIHFKSEKIWHNNYRGGTIRESGTIRKNTVRMKKLPFSEMGDSFLKQWVLRYGIGKWTGILNDSNYKFHSS